MRVAGWALIGTVVAGAACQGDVYGTAGGGCIPTATRVCMENSAFDPPTLQVAPGTVVTWRNGDGVNHTVTSNQGEVEMFDQTVRPGESFTYQFDSFDTIDYYCRNHGAPLSGMHGRITVKQ